MASVKGALKAAFEVVSGAATATFGHGNAMDGVEAADYTILKAQVTGNKIKNRLKGQAT